MVVVVVAVDVDVDVDDDVDVEVPPVQSWGEVLPVCSPRNPWQSR